jgi:hypothetical protein
MKLPEQEARHFIKLYSVLIGWCSGRLDPKGKVRNVQAFLDVEVADKADARDRMLDNPEIIDEFLSENRHKLGADDLTLIGAWRTFVRGDMVVERDLKKHTVILKWNEDPIAYAVLSLTDEVVDLLPLPPPMLVEAVLLPWKGAIVCDGIVRCQSVHLGAGIRRSLKVAYREAKARGIVTTLEAEQKPGPKKNRPASKKSARKGSTMRNKKAAQPGEAFVGKWRIVEMDAFDEDYFEMEGPAFIEIEKARTGRFNFGLVSGEMDCQFSTDGDAPLMEFSWDGNDEHHPVMGRGRAVVGDDGRMRGRIFTHHADDTGFVAERVSAKGKTRRRSR